MENYIFIVNPMAGKGRGKKILQTLKAHILKSFPTAEIITTEIGRAHV